MELGPILQIKLVRKPAIPQVQQMCRTVREKSEKFPKRCRPQDRRQKNYLNRETFLTE